jgi:glutathione S-transferase
MIELYFHHEASPFVRKVLLAADELGVALELRRVDFTSQEAMDEYATVNPNRRFPAIRDGELVLWESNAILRYLASGCDPQWLGGTRASAAVVDQWLCWELAHLGPTLLGLQNARLGFLPRPVKDEATLALDAGRALAVLEAALADHAFVAGESITIADLALACTFAFAEEAGLLDPRFAAVERWLSSIRSRDAWQRTEQQKRDVLAAHGLTLPPWRGSAEKPEEQRS